MVQLMNSEIVISPFYHQFIVILAQAYQKKKLGALSFLQFSIVLL
jgi:hypothetical protein